MKRPEVYLFLDTNVFMHFTMFDEVYWPSLVEGAHVVLCVAKVVVGELDKHKTDPRLSRRKRDRVRSVLRKLDAIFESDDGAVRDGVTLTLFSHPARELAPDDLDLSRPDDAFVATAHLYRQANPDLDVRVVSADTGPRASARALGVALVRLPDEWELPPEPDDSEVELRRVRSQLTEIQSRSPRLELRFKNDTGAFDVRLEEVPLATKHVLEALADRQIAIRRQKDPALFAHGVDAHVRYQEIENQRKLNLLRRRAAATFRIDLVLHNVGTAPASDIHVAVKFPESVTVGQQRPGKLDDETDEQGRLARLGPEPRIAKVYGDPEWSIDGSVAEFPLERLKQYMASDLPVLYAHVADPADWKPFQIVGTIIVSELSEKLEFALSVRIGGQDA
jgi:hypothetical protein